MAASSHLLYLGTYTKTSSKGIYTTSLDDETGQLSAPRVLAETKNPTWLVQSGDKKFLYTIHASRAQAIGFALEPAADGGLLTPLPFGPDVSLDPIGAPSPLALDATGKVLLAANYGDGFVAAIAVKPDGTLGRPTIYQHHGKGVNPERQEKPHVHSVTLSPDNRFAIVCDLGLDKIFVYAVHPDTATLTPGPVPFVATKPEAGPRHFKFSLDGKFGYAINELDNTVAVYAYDAEQGRLDPKQILSTLPPDFSGTNTASEVRVHPNGRFLYGANRGHDSIAVYATDAASGKLTLLEITPTQGKNPRNFALSPNGKWLVCGHQDSENVVVFRVDETTGKLTLTPNTINVPMCVCVFFAD